MALPCGHRRPPDLSEEEQARRVIMHRCPICPDLGLSPLTRPLWRQQQTCRACLLSAGACPCCSYHWTVHEGQARNVIAPVDHPAVR